MFRRLKNKILFSYLLVILSSFLVTLLTTSFFIRKTYFSYALEDLRDDARLFIDEFTRQALLKKDTDFLNKILLKAEESYDIDILDNQGTILANSKGKNIGQNQGLALEEFRGLPSKGYGYSIKAKELLYLAIPVMERNKLIGFVRISTPLVYIEKTIKRLRVYFTLIFILAIAVSFVLGIVLSKNISSPLLEMAELAKAVSSGDLNKQIRIGQRKDEIGILISTFNSMVERLKINKEERENIINNIAHELMTPITTIRGFAETLFDGKVRDKSEMEECLEAIRKESNYLEGLIDELNLLTRIDALSMKYEFKPLDVREVIQDAQEGLSLKAREKEIKFENDFIAGVPNINADYQALRQVFINLLDNAVKYSLPKGLVLVSITRQDKTLKVVVKDNGIGISSKDKGRIFERFYRIEDGLHVEKGLGLGLAIVKEILSSHKAAISVESQLHQGSQFIITFPLS